MIEEVKKYQIKIGKKEVVKFIRNFFLTFMLLLPVVGFLLYNDTVMAVAPMDKKPWVHWNGLNPSKEVFVTWETKAESSSYLQYGTDPSLLNQTISNETKGTLHRLLLTGLTPNTKYFYRVSNDQGTIWYATGSFRTAPSPEDPQSFSFAILSDTQNFMGTGHYPRMTRVLGQQTDLSFVAYAGDMAQDHGQTSILNPDSRQVTWNYFWQNTNEYTDTTPIVSDPGNHDECNAPPEENLFQHYFGIPNAPNHNYYSFNWSRTQFVMVQVADGGDEGRNNDPSLPTYQQDVWINATLEAGQGMDYRIMVFHRALYSCNGNNKDMINRFMPILVHYNVSILFYGHEHTYERFYIQNRNLVCLGCGGGLINGLSSWQAGEQAVGTSPSFTKVSIDTTGITLTTLSPTLNIIDQVRLNKIGSTVVPEIIREE